MMTRASEMFLIYYSKGMGINTTIYANGELLMHNDFELPDLFIIDKQLSGIDGLELCRFLKAQEATRNIPVIIISASRTFQHSL
jgi:CheY-like chemotaxis protein